MRNAYTQASPDDGALERRNRNFVAMAGFNPGWNEWLEREIDSGYIERTDWSRTLRRSLLPPFEVSSAR